MPVGRPEDTLRLTRCTLRPFRFEDAPALARHANDLDVWRNLRDRFPHPYTLADAESWIGFNLGAGRLENWAIEVDGEAAGSIGVMPKADVHRLCAEVGYWLGRAYWGRGVLTEALTAFTPFALERFALARLEADVFATNAASMRVLEKAGYAREGVHRSAVVKDGRILDMVVYARVR